VCWWEQRGAGLSYPVDVNIVEAVVKTGLDDLLAFAGLCLNRQE
jgi:hypothetical protein